MIRSFPEDPLAQGILKLLIALSWPGPSRGMIRNQLKVTTRDSQHTTLLLLHLILTLSLGESKKDKKYFGAYYIEFSVEPSMSTLHISYCCSSIN